MKDEGGIDIEFRLVEPQTQIINIETNQISNSDGQKRAKAIGETLSTGTTLASVGTDILAVITAVIAADRSGTAMKFSQVCKLISRLRLIDINFGKELGTFLDGMGKIFDKSYTVDIETQLKIFLRKLKVTRVYGRGRQRKFDRYAVDMFLFGTMRNNWEDKVI